MGLHFIGPNGIFVQMKCFFEVSVITLMIRFRPRLRPLLPPPNATVADDPLISTKSFNAAITRLSSEGFHNDVLRTFSSMLESNIVADSHTYPSLFKACTSLGLFSHGRSLHKRLIYEGYSSDSYVSSSLITFYAKFSRVKSARHVFDKMTERNVIPWTAMIGCYSSSGDFERSFDMFNSMRREGVLPSSVTLLTLLSGLNEVVQLESIHAIALQYGLDYELNLANCMLHLYAVCGRRAAARDLFDAMLHRDVVSWNSLVSGYAQSGGFQEIFCVLQKMRVEGVKPDQQSFGALLLSANTYKNGFDLRAIHGQIIADGVLVDAPLATPLVGLYLRFGDSTYAFRVFERASNMDAILWTALISGLVQSDCADKALTVFNKMLLSEESPSTATIATVLSACAEVNQLHYGTSVHGYLLRQGIKLDIPVQNALITMYAKCGHLKKSSFVFTGMLERDVVSWNAIVAGFAQNGDLCKALLLFDEMRMDHLKPDSITVVSLLQACASLGVLEFGRGIHCFIIKTFFNPCIMAETAVLDMYSKCGDLDSAQKCFDWMPERDIVPWSTIIAGYGSHGRGEIALELLSEFLKAGHQPNHVIFLSALFSCSHNGLVSEGLSLFKSMVEDFRIKPRIEHHACIVDMLCKAGKLEDAYSFYEVMISDPTIDVLGIILDACRAKGNIELGEMVAKEIVSYKPVTAENYVQLAQGYAAMNRWDGVAESWTQMKSLGLKKVPGWSYVEQSGSISTFFMDHCSHPLYEEMMSMLAVIGHEMSDSVVDLQSKCMEDIYHL